MVFFADTLSEIEVIPTGLFVDKISGIGGIPRGSITEIFGDEGLGKSTLSYQIVAAAQKQGLNCLWADVEWSYDARYAALIGVDNSKLGVIRHEIAEPLLDEIIDELRSEKWDLVIFDSVGGLHSRGESEKDAEGKMVASQAGLMARFCRKVVPIIAIDKIALIMINHSFVDIMSGRHLTSGGKKLAYHKSLSIRLANVKGGTGIYQGDKMIGKKVQVEVKKNKHAGTEGTLYQAQFFFGIGFSAGADVVNDAIEKGILTKEGNSYYFDGEKLGVGINATRKKVEDDPELQEKIKALL